VTAPERAALQARIAEAIAREGVYPVAQRTLALLAEASLEPSPADPFYRVVDRAGAPRHITDAEGRTAPMAIGDLFAELRARHPGLFLPPPPEPEPVPEPPAVVPAEDFKAATARFVGAQSVFARSLVSRSALRGRALAATVSNRLAALRPRAAEPLPGPTATSAEPSLGSTTPPAEPGRASLAAGRLGARARDATGYARGRIADTASRLRDRTRDRDTLIRRALPLGLGAVALVTVVALLGGRSQNEGGTAPSEPQAQAQAPAAGANSPPSAPDMSPAPAEDAPAKPARPNEISGPAEVIDTATLRVGGKLVRLFGVEWVRGGQAEELTRYLAGRVVACQPVAGSEARLCSVDGRDLSEVVLFNGGGRASPEATPDLVAAEDRARAERLGVWAR